MSIALPTIDMSRTTPADDADAYARRTWLELSAEAMANTLALAAETGTVMLNSVNDCEDYLIRSNYDTGKVILCAPEAMRIAREIASKQEH